ncbi:helix-turn-helix domain-containing protein [bacterium]|nr:helix-turn-helix domain-containing protein [bacterium]
MVFSQKLKKILKEKHISQTKLAEIMGVPVTLINKYVNGKVKNPRIETMKKITTALDVSPGYFMNEHSTADPMIYEEVTKIPVLGVVPAGIPIEAVQDVIGEVYVPAHQVKGKKVYGLKVKGDSMINAHIEDGDMVIISRDQTCDNGEIGVFLVGNEDATLKRFYKMGPVVILKADNPKYEPIVIHEDEDIQVEYLGKVLMVVRNI